MTDPLHPELFPVDEPAAVASIAAAADPADADPAAAGPAADDGDADEADEKVAPPSTARKAAEWVVVIVVALLVAFVVRTFVLAHFVVDGHSMESTLHDGDRVFVNKIGYRFHDPRRGDVVVLHESGTSRNGAVTRDRDLIKRVIGLPGETISMVDCEVRINGVVLDEPYLDEEHRMPGGCGPAVPPQVVPDGAVFVLGDNRDDSKDSRSSEVGPVDHDDIVGRAFVIFWPWADRSWL